jgi:short-subunit dehydrogenase
MSHPSKGTALVTGASTGIGAVYADRLARRGHDLIVVARDQGRLERLAERLRAQTGVKVDVLRADLTDKADLAAVEQRLESDPSITLLVNNAGGATPGGFEGSSPDTVDGLIQLNVVAVARLAAAAVPGFLARGGGTIVNIASVLALAPEFGMGVYSATKAFVLTFSQSLNMELGGKGLRVQAVLPAATRTEIWERSGRSVDDMPAGSVMSAEDLVDAALVGLDKGETVTIPPLADEGQWQALEAARLAMLPNFRSDRPAARYRAVETAGA